MSFPKPLQSYEILNKHQIETGKLIEWHFIEIVKSLKRKITLKRKFTNPFTCTVTRDLHKNTFYEVFRAVRDFEVKFGTHTSVLRNKKNCITSYTIIFEHFGALKFHLSKLTKKDKTEVVEFLSKSFSCGSKAEIIATEEKPVVLCYRCSNNILTLKCHYKIENVYGRLTSF